jgi:hypothetical protein
MFGAHRSSNSSSKRLLTSDENITDSGGESEKTAELGNLQHQTQLVKIQEAQDWHQ